MASILFSTSDTSPNTITIIYLTLQKKTFSTFLAIFSTRAINVIDVILLTANKASITRLLAPRPNWSRLKRFFVNFVWEDLSMNQFINRLCLFPRCWYAPFEPSFCAQFCIGYKDFLRAVQGTIRFICLAPYKAKIYLKEDILL